MPLQFPKYILIQKPHFRIFLRVLFLLYLWRLGLPDAAAQFVRYRIFALRAEASRHDGSTAVFTGERNAGIRRKLKPLLPEPLMYLVGGNVASLRHLGDGSMTVILDILFYFLKLLLQFLTADRAEMGAR